MLALAVRWLLVPWTQGFIFRTEARRGSLNRQGREEVTAGLGHLREEEWGQRDKQKHSHCLCESLRIYSRMQGHLLKNQRQGCPKRKWWRSGTEGLGDSVRALQRPVPQGPQPTDSEKTPSWRLPGGKVCRAWLAAQLATSRLEVSTKLVQTPY